MLRSPNQASCRKLQARAGCSFTTEFRQGNTRKNHGLKKNAIRHPEAFSRKRQRPSTFHCQLRRFPHLLHRRCWSESPMQASEEGTPIALFGSAGECGAASCCLGLRRRSSSELELEKLQLEVHQVPATTDNIFDALSLWIWPMIRIQCLSHG